MTTTDSSCNYFEVDEEYTIKILVAGGHSGGSEAGKDIHRVEKWDVPVL